MIICYQIKKCGINNEKYVQEDMQMYIQNQIHDKMEDISLFSGIKKIFSV